MEPDRRLLEADRRVDRPRRAAAAGRRRTPSRLLGLFEQAADRSASRRARSRPDRARRTRSRSASLRARSPTSSRAAISLPARTIRAPARRSSASTIGRRIRSSAGVETLDERVRVVQAAAVDAHDHLRARRVERLALQPLDRLTAHLAVEVAGAGPPFEPGERGLVRGSPGANDEAAAARGAGRAERDRLRGPAHDDARRDAAAELDLVVEEERPFRIGLRSRVADELERLAGQGRAGARGSRPRGSAAAGRDRRRADAGARSAAAADRPAAPSPASPRAGSRDRVAPRRVAAVSSTCV